MLILSPSRTRLWPDLSLTLLLVLLPCLFFWRLLTSNPADRNFIKEGDFTEQYFPLRAFVANEWVNGRIPLWNPYLYGGQPALADIQSGALYPPHLLQALLLGWGGPLFGQQMGFPLRALEGQVILHFSLAAAGTYWFFHYLGQKSGFPLRRARFGGVIASLAFTYSGYLTGFPVQQLTILQTSAWLPWLLWGLAAVMLRAQKEAGEQGSQGAGGKGTEELREKGEQGSGGAGEHESKGRIYAPGTTHYVSHFTFHVLRPILLSALTFALAILAGHPQTVLYIFYLTLAYSLFLAFWGWRVALAGKEEGTPGKEELNTARGLGLYLARALLLWFSVILLGTALTAAQLLPTLEFIAHSVRSELSYEAVSAGLPLTELIAILYPGFFGGSPEYVGLVSLVLIALTLMLSWSKWLQEGPRKSQPSISLSFSNGQIFFWAGAGLVSLLLAFGGNLFVYPLFYLLAPGFEAVRQQERVFFIYSFSAAILAGYGAVALTGPLNRRSRQIYSLFERRLWIIGGIALALTGFYIYGATNATARDDEANLFYGVLSHHFFGLLILGGILVALALRPRRWLRRGWGMALLAGWLAFNLFSVNWRFNLEQREQPTPFVPDGVTLFLQAQPDISLGRIASGGLLPGGNSAASVYQLQDLTGNTPLHLAGVELFLQQMPAWRLWQLMNVRYIVADRDITTAGLEPVFAEGERRLFRMGDPFERAWFVSTVEAVADDQQALARLASDDFNLRTTAIVETPLALSPAENSSSTVTVTGFSPTHLSLAVNAASQQLLVLSQVYYPGWQAHLDGQPVELRRVNLVQQGLVIPAGTHEVQLNFWPSTFAWGMAISVVTFLICGAGLLMAQ